MKVYDFRNLPEALYVGRFFQFCQDYRCAIQVEAANEDGIVLMVCVNNPQEALTLITREGKIVRILPSESLSLTLNFQIFPVGWSQKNTKPPEPTPPEPTPTSWLKRLLA